MQVIRNATIAVLAASGAGLILFACMLGGGAVPCLIAVAGCIGLAGALIGLSA